ncbi:lysophospholipase [Pseudomonas sp. MMS21-TM103]|uniref:alpha/beta hydrolase n=1 Tax=Pseudomonas sp. MMS21 TM103 TaxID=2886506 RepID=UPI001EE127CC|nr:alpha/beta hydrolase [Pseudomonas sp. MMS21 TM103]MCG4454044.1 lysophospholipase [Pseudomonas sp. MMS21 TM103]
MSRIFPLLAVLAALYLAICVAVWMFQRSLIYFPQPLAISRPDTLLRLAVDDAEVLVSIRPHTGPKALIYFGGNAEDVSLNLPAFAQAFPEHALYLMHYRGYAGSAGSPSEEAIQRDALALFDRVHAAHPQTVVMGRSLGSAVAIRLASQRPASRLVLITPFDSLQAFAARQFPLLPIKWLLKDRFESSRYAARIRVPTLLIAAEQDEIIPLSSTEALYRHFAPGVATLEVISGQGHNSISESPAYLPLLRAAM